MGEYGGVCGTLSVDAGLRLPHMAGVKRNHYVSPALIPAWNLSIRSFTTELNCPRSSVGSINQNTKNYEKEYQNFRERKQDHLQTGQAYRMLQSGLQSLHRQALWRKAWYIRCAVGEHSTRDVHWNLRAQNLCRNEVSESCRIQLAQIVERLSLKIAFGLSQLTN